MIEQKQTLERIAKELGGKIEYYLCSDLHTEHKKIVIIYDKQKKQRGE